MVVKGEAETEADASPARRVRRRRLLDLDLILDAALTCIDGTGRLTMSDLASRLGTSPSAVYHHLSGRVEVIELLRERTMAAALRDAWSDDGDWQEQLAGWMRAYRAALAAHPNLIPLLVEVSISSAQVLVAYDRVAGLLSRAGAPPEQVLLWIAVLDSYALGAALDLTAPDDVWRVADQGLPSLEDAVQAAPSGRERADAAFELGLTALLTGMRHHLAG